MMDKSYFIITDSGGVQEEASIGYERPEAGTVKLVGINTQLIIKVTR